MIKSTIWTINTYTDRHTVTQHGHHMPLNIDHYYDLNCPFEFSTELYIRDHYSLQARFPCYDNTIHQNFQKELTNKIFG